MKDEKVNNNHLPDVGEKVDLKRFCMGIINQLFDLAEVPVEKRQSINDAADEYLLNQISELVGRYSINPPNLSEKVDPKDAEIARIKSEIEYHEFLLEDYKEQVRVLEALKDHDKYTHDKSTLTLPDGTTVDLTKPIQGLFDGAWFDVLKYIGMSTENEFVCEIHDVFDTPFAEFKHIRNKPEEVKPTTLSELSNGILSEAFHILFGSEYKRLYHDFLKAGEIRAIINGEKQPSIPFKDWVKFIEFLNSKLPTI